MREFLALLQALDETNATLGKIKALENYFKNASASDAAWALYLLSGRKLKRMVAAPVIRAAASQAFGVEPWLFEESYANVGDLAETIALLSRKKASVATDEFSLSAWIRDTVLPLSKLSKEEQSIAVQEQWATLSPSGIYLFNKILTGGFRAGVSLTLVTRALAQSFAMEPATMALRLMGEWDPNEDFFNSLGRPDEGREGRPYPFFLAHPVGELDLEKDLGPVSEYLAEWKWDGIRGQLLRRNGVHLWSRGEELLTERFPEIAQAAAALPEGTVIDGEILAEREGQVLPFQLLQQRIQRLKPTANIIRDVPIAFYAFDLLEWQGVDLRDQPLSIRRQKLLELTLLPPMFVPTPLKVDSWKALGAEQAKARVHCAEGLMLKRWDSMYGVGRKRGPWWKWKLDPRTIDAVLIYAQAGHGRRSNLHSDYTFAVWKDGELVPVAKAYSGLTDREIESLDRWIRSHTLEKFGPVRSVEPKRVFEIAFEGIGPSKRHKAGVALRFPRILREREDKTAQQADRLETLWELAHAR